MTTLTLDATKLKTIRKARKMGRPKLAKQTGLTERMVARLEATTTEQTSVSAEVIARIAAALHIPEAVLTGELPMMQEDLQPVQKSTCTSGCCG